MLCWYFNTRMAYLPLKEQTPFMVWILTLGWTQTHGESSAEPLGSVWPYSGIPAWLVSCLSVNSGTFSVARLLELACRFLAPVWSPERGVQLQWWPLRSHMLNPRAGVSTMLATYRPGAASGSQLKSQWSMHVYMCTKGGCYFGHVGLMTIVPASWPVSAEIHCKCNKTFLVFHKACFTLEFKCFDKQMVFLKLVWTVLQCAIY